MEEYSMELKEAIEQRASVRRFTDEPVEHQDILEMIRRAGRAPSINNDQPWKFIVISNRLLIKRMANEVHKKIKDFLPEDSEKAKSIKFTVEYFSTIFEKAPVVVAVVTKPYETISEWLFHDREKAHSIMNEMRFHPDIQSVGAAVQNILLSAADLGYGACWLSGMLIARTELEQLLHIEQPSQLATFVAIGKPAGVAAQAQKKNIEEIYSLLQ
jgi:nitroreductase